MAGSWWQLWSIGQEALREYELTVAATYVISCPRDGQPLENGPPQRPAMKFCRFCGWQFPRDWHPPSHL